MLIRSKLFVPGSRPEFFAKAYASAADCVSFDLEDAVAPEKKEEARASIAAFLAQPPLAAKVSVVRVNAVGSLHCEADIAAVAGTHLDIVNLPMVEEVEAIHAAATLLDRAGGAAAHIRLLVNIETPKGLRHAAALAGAHPRVMGLQIGYADLFEPHGIQRRDAHALAHVRLSVRLAAAEAGVVAYDGAFADVRDVEGFKAECEAARAHGFGGKSCIHPSQIDIANAAFLPSPREIAAARRIVAAAQEAEANTLGAYMVDGRMIDKPFVEGARALLALAESAAGKDA